MMDSEHTLSLISDYVLGLLPAGERRRVEAHARQCPDCRMALQRERQVEMLVRGAVHQTAQPAPGRLLALRPAVPAPRQQARQQAQRLYYQLAPVTLIAVLLALGLLIGSGRPPFTTPGLFVATSSATSTATDAPTITATAATPNATLASADTTATAATAEPVPLVEATPVP